LAQGLRVTAIDRAKMEPEVLRHQNLRFFETDCRNWRPSGGPFQGLFCDMNSDPRDALDAVVRILPLVEGPVGITLKLGSFAKDSLVQDVNSFAAQLERALHQKNPKARVFAKHFWHNRNEVTLLGL
jgi:23S rRNA (cytidine2498-2'-O)-methyltransferase